MKRIRLMTKASPEVRKQLHVILSSLLSLSHPLHAPSVQFVLFDTSLVIVKTGTTFEQLPSLLQRNKIVLGILIWKDHCYLLQWQGAVASTIEKAKSTSIMLLLEDYFSRFPIIFVKRSSQLSEEALINAFQDKQNSFSLNSNGVAVNHISNLIRMIDMDSAVSTPPSRRKSSINQFAKASVSLMDPACEVYEAYHEITSSKTAQSWAVIEYRTREEGIVVSCRGSGGIEEAREHLVDTKVQFVLMHFLIQSRRERYKQLLLTWIGPEVAESRKPLALLGTKLCSVLSGIHKEFRISSRAELTYEELLHKVRQFVHADELVLKVVVPNAATSLVYVGQEDTVLELKECIARRYGIPEEAQFLWIVVSNFSLKYGEISSESQYLTEEDAFLVNDCKLRNIDRIYVKNTKSNDECLTEINQAEVRLTELNTQIRDLTENSTEISDEWLNFSDIVIIDENPSRGKTASVFKALWHVAEVALKKWNYGRLRKEMKDMFLKEVNTLRLLSHPNIVRYVGACLEPTLCIVTEWVPRGSLHDFLVLPQAKELRAVDKLRMCLDVAQGMRYLHSKNIMHRDLKSHNLLVDENWTVKVADFGIARTISGENEKALTQCGTSGWIAPEVLESVKEYGIGGYDFPIDVFSFGVCCWEIATCAKENPLTGLPEEEFVRRVQSGPRRMPGNFPKDTPGDLVALIHDCWRFEPEERPDFEEIVKRLQTLVHL